MPIELITWKSREMTNKELMQYFNIATNEAIKDLVQKKLPISNKTAIIYSASFVENGLESELKTSPVWGALSKFYNFHLSSQEFMIAIFVLFIPEDFDTSNDGKVSILSQMYQSITRAQTKLVFVADPTSVKRMLQVIPKIADLVMQKDVHFIFFFFSSLFYIFSILATLHVVP